MLFFKQPTTNIWITIYIVVPLLPFLLGGIIRLVISSWNLTWTTFDASELAICFALLCLFINQNLLKNEILLSNSDKEEDIESKALGFLILGIIFIALFIINVLCEATIDFHNVPTLEIPLHTFQLFVFIFTIPTLNFSISVQRSFKLKADI